MRFRGRVVRQQVARGSKSERTAVVLRTARRDYVLRRVGGHAMRDPQVDALIGHTVEGEGVVRDYVLVMSTWQIVD